MGIWKPFRKKFPPYVSTEEAQYQDKVEERKREILGTDNNQAEMASPAMLGRLYVTARQRKEDIEKNLKDVNISINALTQMLFENMEGEGTESIKLASGVSISLRDEPIASAVNRIELVDWALKTNQKANLTIWPMTLSSIVKDCLKQGKAVPPGVNVFMKRGLTVTGLKGAANDKKGEEE